MSAAAAIRNAADDASPGTVPSNPSCWNRRTRNSPSRRSIGAPSAASARSVWSRVGDRLGDRGRRPSAASPASRTALLTCALGTSGANAMPVQRPALDPHRRMPVGRSRPSAPIVAQRAGDPLHRACWTGSRRRSGPTRTAPRRARPRAAASWCRSSRSRGSPAGATSPSRPSPSTSRGDAAGIRDSLRSTWNRHPPPARRAFRAKTSRAGRALSGRASRGRPPSSERRGTGEVQ